MFADFGRPTLFAALLATALSAAVMCLSSSRTTNPNPLRSASVVNTRPIWMVPLLNAARVLVGVDDVAGEDDDATHPHAAEQALDVGVVLGAGPVEADQQELAEPRLHARSAVVPGGVGAAAAARTPGRRRLDTPTGNPTNRALMSDVASHDPGRA